MYLNNFIPGIQQGEHHWRSYAALTQGVSDCGLDVICTLRICLCVQMATHVRCYSKRQLNYLQRDNL